MRYSEFKYVVFFVIFCLEKIIFLGFSLMIFLMENIVRIVTRFYMA